MTLDDAISFSLTINPRILDSINTETKNVKLFFSQIDYGLGEIVVDEIKVVLSETPYRENSSKRPNSLSITGRSLSTSSPKCVKQAPQQVTSFHQNPEDFVAASQDLDPGTKSFSCKLCGYSTKWRQHVVRHFNLKHITGGTVIKCNLCEHSTKLKADMKKHYMSKHGLPEAMAKSALY